MTRAARPLTPRQMRFVDEYMIDLNAAAAARRAGYGARRARAQGYELRNTPRINAEIRARMAELSFSTRIQVERVAVELGRAAFANPQGLVSKDGRLLELEELDPDFAQVMRAETRKDPKGGKTLILRQLDKTSNLDKLARYLGMYHRNPGRYPREAPPDDAGKVAPWRPLPGPQTEAFTSPADVIGFGGAAGGGKTDLAIGLALTRHRKSAIFRRDATQMTGIIERMAELCGGRAGYSGAERVWRTFGRRIEFGSCPHLGDERRHQGRDKDLLVIDEAQNFLESQARIGRSPDRGDAVCLALIATPKREVRRERRTGMSGGTSWMG